MENKAQAVDAAEVNPAALPAGIDIREERRLLRRYLRGQLNAEFKANFRYFLPAWLARTKGGQLGYDVRVHLAVSMPDEIIAQIQRAGQEAAAETLIEAMTPDERLKFAAEAKDRDALVEGSAGKGTRSSDEPNGPPDLSAEHDVLTCEDCAEGSCCHPDVEEYHGN